MNFGATVGKACATFAVTNIDDIFVLVTFFAEASTGKGLTPLQITTGQYVGFTVIIVISMIGYGASLLFSPEPIGFLGLLPLLMGTWWMFGLVFPTKESEPPDEVSDPAADTNTIKEPNIVWRWVKNMTKVGSVTVMNGADNIGTYVPLFSQAKGAEIAVYVVVYYILLGVWCLAAFLVMKQKHILHLAQKYAHVVVPFLYLGLGIFIIIESECYPWSIEKIDHVQHAPLGTSILAVVTTVLFLVCIGVMLWLKLRKRAGQQPLEGQGDEPTPLELAVSAPNTAFSGDVPSQRKESETPESGNVKNG